MKMPYLEIQNQRLDNDTWTPMCLPHILCYVSRAKKG